MLMLLDPYRLPENESMILRGILSATILAALLACSDDVFIPAEADVRRQFGPFLPDDVVLHPVARYNDVDAMIAWYCVKRTSTSLWPDLATSAARGWTLEAQTRSERTFHRSTSGRITGYEIVKLQVANDRCVCMAWLQADQTTRATFEASSEARWAAGVLWPRFQKVRVQVAATRQ